jgi:two-component system, NarL family, sensor histidine kinase DegS
VTDHGAQPSIQELHAKASADLERAKRELAEIENLIRQTSSEVEKLQQRELTVSSRLRDLEVNIDRYQKADIKNLFTSAQEVQMRLVSMRGQLEQLTARQQMMKNRQSQLFELTGALEPLIRASATSGAAARAADNGDDLIANIIQAQEKERLRISLQMHDGPAQALSNLVLRAEICQRLIDRDLDMARGELGGLKSAINGVLQETRRFIFDLRPMTLDDLGLVPTLRRYIQQFNEKNKIEVNLMTQNAETRLPTHYEVAIFRFIQEALNNIGKHANANTARVLLDYNAGSIHVSVDDDGSGFSIKEVLSNENGRRNMGIATMRQQVEMLMRGEFGIESAVGRGTRVAAVIPLP